MCCGGAVEVAFCGIDQTDSQPFECPATKRGASDSIQKTAPRSKCYHKKETGFKSLTANIWREKAVTNVLTEINQDNIATRCSNKEPFPHLEAELFRTGKR